MGRSQPHCPLVVRSRTAALTCWDAVSRWRWTTVTSGSLHTLRGAESESDDGPASGSMRSRVASAFAPLGLNWRRSKSVLARKELNAILDTIGGREVAAFAGARSIGGELNVQGHDSLVAPPEARRLPAEVIAPYRPFDIIERIQVPGESLGKLSGTWTSCRWRSSIRTCVAPKSVRCLGEVSRSPRTPHRGVDDRTLRCPSP